MVSWRLLFWHLHTANCSSDRPALSPCDEIRHDLNCLTGFRFFKCSVLIPSVEVSLEIRFTVKISIKSPFKCKVQKQATVQQCNGTYLPIVFPLIKRQRSPWLNFCHLPDVLLATLLNCTEHHDLICFLYFFFFSHSGLIVRGNIWTLLFGRFLDILTNAFWKVILIWWGVI